MTNKGLFQSTNKASKNNAFSKTPQKPVKISNLNGEKIVNYGGFNISRTNLKEEKFKPCLLKKEGSEISKKLKMTPKKPNNNMKFVNTNNLVSPETKEINSYKSNSSQFINLFSTYESDILNKAPISDNDIFINKKLEINEIEGCQLENKPLIINCGGMLNGKRKKRDGVSIFGLEFNNATDTTNTNYDFTFKFKHSSTLSNNISNNSQPMTSLFFIYFSKEKKKYYIRNIEQRWGNENNNILNSSMEYHINATYFLIKIQNEFYLNDINFIMIGDVFFLIKEDGKNLSVTKLKSKNSPGELSKLFMQSTYFNKKIYTIGRSRECDLSFSLNKAFSKVHCSFTFENNCWKLIDGNGIKPSTNGVWMLPIKSFEIYDGMEFKVVGCSKCKVKLKD